MSRAKGESTPVSDPSRPGERNYGGTDVAPNYPGGSTDSAPNQDEGGTHSCLESIAVWNTLVADCFWYANLFLLDGCPALRKKSEEEQSPDASGGKEKRPEREEWLKGIWDCKNKWVEVIGDALLWPLKVYLRYPLRWTVNSLADEPCVLYTLIAFLSLVAAFAMYHTIDGLMNLTNTTQDMHTLQMIESTPVTPVILAAVTHLVLSFYGAKQRNGFKEGHPPPSPALYVFLIGKAFMLIRLVIAYSAADLGGTLNFFVFEELLLICIHLIASVVLLGKFSRLRLTLTDQVNVVKIVFFIDLFKTVPVILYWYFYSPGWVRELFERLPSQVSRISCFLLIHASFDMLQSTATVFTLYIAAYFQHKEEAGKVADIDSPGSPKAGQLQPAELGFYSAKTNKAILAGGSIETEDRVRGMVRYRIHIIQREFGATTKQRSTSAPTKIRFSRDLVILVTAAGIVLLVLHKLYTLIAG